MEILIGNNRDIPKFSSYFEIYEMVISSMRLWLFYSKLITYKLTNLLGEVVKWLKCERPENSIRD